MQVDLVTPLCTQLTYEGLIDEVFGIKNGVVQLELGAEGARFRAQWSSSRFFMLLLIPFL